MSEETKTQESAEQEQEQATEQVTTGQGREEVQNDWRGRPRSREATPPPDGAEPEETELQDMMVKRLYKDMGILVEDEKAKDEPEPEEKPAEEKAEGEKPAEEAEPEPQPRTTVQSKEDLTKEFMEEVRDAVRTGAASQSQPTEALPIPPAEPAKPEEVDETEGLMDEQKMEVELMQQAEIQMPEKYKGFKGKTLDFYKDMNVWLDKKSGEDEDFGYENNAEEIDRYVEKNKPSLSKVDEKKVERGMMRQEAMDEFEKKSEGKFLALEKKTRMIEERPKIQAETERFRTDILDIKELEAAALLKSGNIDDAKAKYPMEAQVAMNVSNQVSKLYEDYLHYERGIATFEEKKDSLSYLDEFLTTQAEYFATNGGEYRVREGKQFMTVKDFNRIRESDPEKASKHWTFDTLDVRELLAAEARGQIKKNISEMEEQISKYGYVRKPLDSEDQPKETAPSQQAEPISTPKSKVSAAPGPADGAKIKDPNHPGENIIGTLGMREAFPQMIE